MTTSRSCRALITVLMGAAGATLSACSSGQPVANEPAPVDSVSIGYGTVGSGSVTGAVSTIEGSDHRVTTVEQMLQRVPGLEVVGSGTGISVRLRGPSSFYLDSEPLFVIDGVPIPGRGAATLVSTVPAHDIKRIHVLKDAAMTSIYGSRGANGVIIVTTKRR